MIKIHNKFHFRHDKLKVGNTEKYYIPEYVILMNTAEETFNLCISHVKRWVWEADFSQRNSLLL